MKTFFNIFLLFSALCIVVSCDDDGKGSSVKQLSQKVTLTLGNYYTESGTTKTSTWGADDMAGLLLPEQNSPAYFASPLQAGGSSGLFTFTIESYSQDSQTVVGFYPSDVDVTCKDGGLAIGLPTAQTGTVSPCQLGKVSGQLATYNGLNIELSQFPCVMYILVEMGNYSISRAEVSSIGGEGIAGTVSLDVDTWEVSASSSTVTVALSSPVDCRDGSRTIAVMLAPVTLSAGYRVTMYDTDGNMFSVNSTDAVSLEQGGTIYTEPVSSDEDTRLVLCGDNMVYIVDETLMGDNYKNAVTWSWDAHTISSITGLSTSKMTHLDDCKPVDNNTKLLLTSSYNWSVLLDISTQEVLFYTVNCPNAHSAALLPNNRIAVACSTGTGDNYNSVQIYDVSNSNVIIDSHELYSAHGVVWNDATQRLYALGGQILQIYELVDWDSSTPSIKLEKSVSTPKSGTHDLNYVDSNTLSVAGNCAYLYSIDTGTFTEMTLFSSSTALKSLNCNPSTGEVWFTDATSPEGDYDWSTHTIRHASNYNDSSTDKTFRVEDMNCYKVRVLSW